MMFLSPAADDGILQQDPLQVFRYQKISVKKISVIVLSAFLRIQLLPLCQILIFRMVQDQVFNAQRFRLLACFFYRRVVLLVRTVQIPVAVKTECLMEQPVRIFSVFFLMFLIRLVSQKCSSPRNVNFLPF